MGPGSLFVDPDTHPAGEALGPLGGSGERRVDKIAFELVENVGAPVTTGCRTLFATHYHELTELADTKQAVANYNVAVREWNEEIIFLHKILPGAADKSYGIQVARLAGLPKPVVERAKSILSHLELHSVKPEAKKQGPKAKNTVQDEMPRPAAPQMDLFSDF